MEPCPDNLVCGSKVDLVIPMDGSGSVGYWGFEAERWFMLSLVEHVEMGEDKGQIGVVLFSDEVEVKHYLSTDKAATIEAIKGIEWPGDSTNTAMALATAMNVFTMGGR